MLTFSNSRSWQQREHSSKEEQLHEAHHSEEKGGLVGLQRGLRIKSVISMALPLCGDHGRCTQFLDELESISRKGQAVVRNARYLLEGLVVDEAGSVLWDLQLTLLDMFPELPGETW